MSNRIEIPSWQLMGDGFDNLAHMEQVPGGPYVLRRDHERRVAELEAENARLKELPPVVQMEAYAFCGDPEDKLTETEKIMKGAAFLIDPLIEKITKERDMLKAENTRLKAPVSDGDDNYCAWLRVKKSDSVGNILSLCDSDSDGAFKVWRKNGIQRMIAARAKEQP